MVRSTPIEPLAVPLSDDVVKIRLRQISDLDAIAAASHDPDTRRWLQDPPMDAEARRTSMARVEEAWRSGQSAPLVIADAATDEPVGIINLQFREEDISTIAYSVFPGNRGRGIAPRAVRLVTGWAFHDLKLTQLVLEADEGNAASIRVAEKCGFERVDSRTESKPDGVRHTTVVFSRSTP